MDEFGEVTAGKARNPNGDGSVWPYLRCANVLDGRIDASDVLTMPFTDAELGRYRLRDGDVLLNEGQSIGLVGRPAVYRGTPPDIAIQNSLVRLRVQRGEVDTEFAYQVVRYLYESGRLSQIATQTTSIAHLGVSRFSALTAPLPPLPEQKKIAAILSSVDEAIRATEAVIEQTRRVKEGLLQDLLTRGIGPDGRPHTRFQQTEIGEIPEGWEVRRLGDVLESCTYGVSCALSSDQVGLPVLRMGNLSRDRLDLRDLKFADLRDADQSVVTLRPGDIVFNRTNSWDLVGKVALVPRDAPPLSYASYLLRLRVRRGLTDATWLWLKMSSPAFQRRLRSLATRGVSQANINPTSLRALRIAVPPLADQQVIGERVTAVDDCADGDHRLAALRRLKAGLLQDLLTGKVRVTP